MAQADFSRISTNIGALNALNSMRSINNKLGIHQNRLATGKRINSAEDDPAGLTIATKMLARSEGLKVAQNNIGDAKNMMAVAEAGLNKVTDILVNMRSKAQAAANDALGSAEREAIQSQLSSFSEQIDNIVAETKWNGQKLLDGTVSKKFQTGADEGEVTTWQLNQKHDADTLNVSEKYASAGISDAVTSTSLTGAAAVSAAAGQSAVKTGSYSFEILDKATSATVGNATAQGTLLTGVTALGEAAATTAGDELKSGTWSMTVNAVASATDVSYTLEHEDGTQIVVNNSNISDGNLNDAAGDNVGVTLSFATDASGLQVGNKMTFDYVSRGQVKLELNDGNGQALQVDRDGAGVGTTYDDVAYVNAGATFNSGRGLQATIATLASVTVGEDIAFDFHEAGNNVVDVSTADKAGAYMTKVDNAINLVTESLSDVGSLMARLTYKEEAISVSQVNTEAAYNRIMNADMAYEQIESTKMGILQQTAISMLSQANQGPQALMSLFR